MAVASDLPELEQPATRNSIIYDRDGHRIGVLTGNEKRLFLRENQIAPVMKHAIIAIEDRRFYTNDGVDLRGIGARALPGRRPAEGRPGRLDDHPAVRQERARRPGRADGVPEAPRGRPRLPPHAQVVEGADPPQLPQHDLLRQRRVRHRGGRAHVLPGEPPRVRRAARRQLRLPARAARGGAAGRHGRVSQRLRPDREPGGGARAAQPGAPLHARPGLPDPAAVRGRDQAAAARPRRPPAAGRGHRLPLLHLVDQAAGRRPPRRRAGGRAAGVRGRPARAHDDRRQAAGGRRRRDRQLAPEPRRPARRAGGASTTTPARSGRWWAATTTTSCRSTSPPRASASPARRSSRSSWPRRCARASRRTRCGSRRR